MKDILENSEFYKKIKKSLILMKGEDCYCRNEGMSWVVTKDNSSAEIIMYVGWITFDEHTDTEFAYISADCYIGTVAKSLEEFRNMTIKDIEATAYNIYMTFAR